LNALSNIQLAYLGSDVLYNPNPLSTAIPLSVPAAMAPSVGRLPRQCSNAAYYRGGKYLYQLAQDLRDSKQYPILNSFTPTALYHNLTNSWDAYTNLAVVCCIVGKITLCLLHNLRLTDLCM
jgi:hypothetical protein